MTYTNSSIFQCPPTQPNTSGPYEHLVQAAQLGSASAFSELHALYEGRIYRTIRSITQHTEDAEDATQDTFIKAYNAIKSFQGRASFYSWLSRIAINSALAVLRKRRACRELSLDLSGQDEGENSLAFRDRSADPEQCFDQGERQLRLVNSIRRLKPLLRVVVEEHIVEEGSAKEIGLRLQISEAAVKSRLHRARLRINETRSFHI